MTFLVCMQGGGSYAHPGLKFGPKAPGHPSIGNPCPGCGAGFQEGDLTALVPVGPGDAHYAREECWAGRPFNAIAIEVHWLCAGGLPEDLPEGTA